MNTITVRIPEELKNDLKKISETEHKPVSDLVRESVRRFVAVERFRKVRRKALPFAEAQGFLISGDKDSRVLKEFGEIKILSPREFYELHQME
jgi:Arc/MetJ-type ribon-helix-helix transcriptional regulator